MLGECCKLSPLRRGSSVRKGLPDGKVDTCMELSLEVFTVKVLLNLASFPQDLLTKHMTRPHCKMPSTLLVRSHQAMKRLPQAHPASQTLATLTPRPHSPPLQHSKLPPHSLVLTSQGLRHSCTVSDHRLPHSNNQGAPL